MVLKRKQDITVNNKVVAHNQTVKMNKLLELDLGWVHQNVIQDRLMMEISQTQTCFE